MDKVENMVPDKIGRNDLCSCGSGKKYKKCCMAAEVYSPANIIDVDFKWQQLRQCEGTVVDHHLTPYVMKELPEDVIHLALADFFPDDLPEEQDGEVLFHQFFMPWFLFNWVPWDNFNVRQLQPSQTLAQNYLNLHGNRLRNNEKRFIEAISQSYYSYYSILDVQIEKSLLVKDILLGTQHTIKERQGTRHLKRGDIVFSRILTLDDQSLFIGMAPFAVPARYQSDLIDLRDWLIKENRRTVLTSQDLRNKYEMLLIDYFFDVMKNAYNKPFPTLMNTDGELVQFTKSYFKLSITPEETLDRLLPLTLEDQSEVFQEEAKKDHHGKIKQLEIPWLVKGNKKHKSWDNTILGHIFIKQGQLILETNSQERAQKGKKLLEQYLGAAIVFQKAVIEAPEQKMKSLPSSRLNQDDVSKELLESPEVQEQMRAMAQKHWEDWFNEPIPALKDQTPREAARTKDGRERLEALLLQYERYDLERSDNVFKANIPYLRKELCLDP